MPQMANVTVKAANGTTDVIYTAQTPSAGDSSPAQWSANAASAARAYRPVIRMVSQPNGPKTARRVTITGKYPVVRVIGGEQTLVGTIPLEFSALLPNLVTDAEAQEATRQFENFLVATLPRECIEQGFAAT